ncbi:MAG: aspartate racemase [Deltaproteobacteria bacterium]|nr:amino acid racemase [Deltaproteobacteria bacterium]RLA91874.1 MAG: aspartate racemase [Deltaproteobacteria bacterium]
MREKIVGILGGMGPEATLYCFDQIIRNTIAKNDQEHLRLIIDSNPKVPDRTAAILGKGESPVPVLVNSGNALMKAGADFIIIPCVSAHAFLNELKKGIKIPILSLFDAVTEFIKQNHPTINYIGMLATTGTIHSGAFKKRLEQDNIITYTPSEEDQKKVMEAIYDIKSVLTIANREKIKEKLLKVVNNLIEKGAQGIIAGCTEIPLVLKQKDLSIPLFDSIFILARAAIKEAGLKPLELS